jgi:hypothetical protein
VEIWVNDRQATLLEGMTVRQALIQLDLLEAVEEGQRVYDEWGNQVGLDGTVEEGQRFEVR